MELFKSQVTVVDGVKSNETTITAGVPQGSRLGPLLFIQKKKHIESDILIHADDTTLIASSANPTETTDILNMDLDKISVWAEKWKVKFNAEKLCSMLYSTKQNLNIPGLLLNGDSIKMVNEHKHLGIFLTSTLNWSKQIHEVFFISKQKACHAKKCTLYTKKNT